MIDFDFRPTTYFDGTGPSSLLARLSYPESQWGEEISIYASTLDGVIYFEVIDFYGNDFRTNPESSTKPLSLQEFIYLIETLENVDGTEEGNVKLTLMGIPEVESTVYPELKKYFMDKRKTFGI